MNKDNIKSLRVHNFKTRNVRGYSKTDYWSTRSRNAKAEQSSHRRPQRLRNVQKIKQQQSAFDKLHEIVLLNCNQEEAREAMAEIQQITDPVLTSIVTWEKQQKSNPRFNK